MTAVVLGWMVKLREASLLLCFKMENGNSM
jgi:hypothetical protein